MHLIINREAIAQRIFDFIESQQKQDAERYSYAAIGKRIGKTREAVRQYAKGDTWPRLDVLYELAAVIGAPIEWLLFGVTWDETEIMSLREKACISKEECQVLDIFRKTNAAGQFLILGTILSIQMAHPISDNVEAFPVSAFSETKKQSI